METIAKFFLLGYVILIFTLLLLYVIVTVGPTALTSILAPS